MDNFDGGTNHQYCGPGGSIGNIITSSHPLQFGPHTTSMGKGTLKDMKKGSTVPCKGERLLSNPERGSRNSNTPFYGYKESVRVLPTQQRKK